MASASSRLRSSQKQSRSLRARSSCNPISYAEDHSDSGDPEVPLSDDGNDAPTLVAARLRRGTAPSPASSTNSRLMQKGKRKAAGPHPQRTTTRSQRGTMTVGSKRRRNTHSREEGGSIHDDPVAVQMTGRTMPWATLPYHILHSIFTYASEPLTKHPVSAIHSPSWLLGMARTCKAFTEPALSVLYHQPTLSSQTDLNNLVSLLGTQCETKAIHYNSKVKHLDLGRIPGFGQQLQRLIRLVPQLRGVALDLGSDDPRLTRYREVRYHEPPLDFYVAIQEAGIHLKSWAWDRSLGYHVQSRSVNMIHGMAPFKSLKALAFNDFNIPRKFEYHGHPNGPEAAFADIIGMLPSLQTLQISNSRLVNARLLPDLPANLESLTLTSCNELASSALHIFLAVGGGSIRQLTINHNQNLNLSFLAGLSQTCPKLEALEMNLLYFNTHTTFRDSEPGYISLLMDGERPSWPSSLRRLELLQLRKWKTAIAETFFASLSSSTEPLPNLRRLVIKASIDESSWRDRIAFRDRWTQRLEEVFRRKSTPPNPHFASIAAFKAWKAQQNISTKVQQALARTQPAAATSDARDHKATHVKKPSPETDSDAPLMMVRRSNRVKLQKDDQSASSASIPAKHQGRRRHKHYRSGADSSDEDSAFDDDATSSPPVTTRDVSEDPDYVQGLCDVVDVVIDNLRPTEEQLRESDFLDEEPSGDEDWNGDDENMDAGLAW